MKNRCFILFLLFSICSHSYIWGQTSVRPDSVKGNHPNAVYIELLGNAQFYSLNYERKLVTSQKWNGIIRAGYSLWDFYLPDGLFSFENKIPVEAIMAYRISPKKHRYLEFSGGGTLTFFIMDTYFFNETSSIKLPQTGDFFAVNPDVFLRTGYRSESRKGFLFRIGIFAHLVPVTDYFGTYETTNEILPWIAICFGKLF